MDAYKLATSTTTDGMPPRPGFENAPAPAPVKDNGQHAAYWVLAEAERAKGFVRPVRRSYLHVGRRVCGKPLLSEQSKLGGHRDICILPPGHDGECTMWQRVSQPEAARAEQEHMLGGCGCRTTMAIAIAETYARDPKYYGSTFCCECGVYLPVGESCQFVWDDANRERVGT